MSIQALGLRIELIQDLGRDGQLTTLAKFKSGAISANLSAFRFAGHGVSLGRQSYAVPLDADPSDPTAI